MTEKKQLIIFGEVLADCFPEGSQVLGGAPFNVAWHCQAFGLSPLFVSRIGDDALGKQIRQTMKNWGMDTSALQLDQSHPTGVVEVTFDDNEPNYEIKKNSAWDFIEAQTLPSKLSTNALLYHGTLASRSPISSRTLNKLKQRYSKDIFIDLNLRDPWWTENLLDNALKQTSFVKLNQHELNIIVPAYYTIFEKTIDLIKRFSLKQVVVTLGEKGAIAFNADGKSYQFDAPQISKVVDTVGAGDAFSSVFLLGLFKNWPLSLTLQRAQEFASKIVTTQGATVNVLNFYHSFIEKWDLQ